VTDHQIVKDRILSEYRRRLKGPRDALFGDDKGLVADDLLSLEEDGPVRGRINPVIKLNTVDFPAPLGPMMDTISPCSI
jgi:hypothetical protein